MKVIELYGLPASGKSYYANELSVDGKSSRPILASRWIVMRYAVKFWLKHPRFTIDLLMIILLYSRGIRDRAIKCLNGLGYRLAYYYCPVPTNSKVIHEGMLHNIYGLSDQVLKRTTIERMLRHMPTLSDVLVCVETTRETRMERARKRGRLLSRVSDQDSQIALDTIISTNFSTLNQLIEANKDLKRKRVLLKDSDFPDINSIV